MTARVFRTGNTRLTVETEDEGFEFMYNPDTQYVLVPAYFYGDRPDLIEAIRSHSEVSGVFNHDCIDGI